MVKLSRSSFYLLFFVVFSINSCKKNKTFFEFIKEKEIKFIDSLRKNNSDKNVEISTTRFKKKGYLINNVFVEVTGQDNENYLVFDQEGNFNLFRIPELNISPCLVQDTKPKYIYSDQTKLFNKIGKENVMWFVDNCLKLSSYMYFAPLAITQNDFGFLPLYKKIKKNELEKFISIYEFANMFEINRIINELKIGDNDELQVFVNKDFRLILIVSINGKNEVFFHYLGFPWSNDTHPPAPAIVGLEVERKHKMNIKKEK